MEKRIELVYLILLPTTDILLTCKHTLIQHATRFMAHCQTLFTVQVECGAPSGEGSLSKKCQILIIYLQPKLSYCMSTWINYSYHYLVQGFICLKPKAFRIFPETRWSEAMDCVRPATNFTTSCNFTCFLAPGIFHCWSSAIENWFSQGNLNGPHYKGSE